MGERHSRMGVRHIRGWRNTNEASTVGDKGDEGQGGALAGGVWVELWREGSQYCGLKSGVGPGL
eukprot:195397-Prymnesium_polylepis.1